MSTIVHDTPQTERRYHERRRNFNPAFLRTEGLKVSWGGIWGGVLVAVGLLMLLSALGLAVGVSAVQPGETDAAVLGTGAGIWASISLLLALFVGGMVATRIGAITDTTTGFFEGSLVWVVSLLLMAYFATSGVSMLASGAFRLVGGATQAIGGVVQGQVGAAGGGAEIDTSGSVDQIVARLRDPQTAQQIANATGMNIDDVRPTLEQTARRIQSNRGDPAQAAEEVRRGVAQLMERAQSSGALERRAEEVQPAAATAAWITFGALVLSLLAAVIGAMVGRRRSLPTTTATTATA